MTQSERSNGTKIGIWMGKDYKTWWELKTKQKGAKEVAGKSWLWRGEGNNMQSQSYCS